MLVRICDSPNKRGRVPVITSFDAVTPRLLSRSFNYSKNSCTGVILSLYSTIWCSQRPGFSKEILVFNRSEEGYFGVFEKVRRLRNGDSILINGALGAREFLIDLLFGIYLRIFKTNVGILISDATWHPRTVPKESKAKLFFRFYDVLLKKILLMCESERTHYCFLSREEMNVFATETKIDRRRIHFTKFCSQLPLEIIEELMASAATSSFSGQVFAGGNSLRDYDTLISALQGLEIKAIIASSNKHKYDPRQIDFKYLSHHDFFRTMARSSVVVVPLLLTEKRSVGQQTYLNAMALGKLLIVSDVIGVRDHLEPDVHALVVPASDVNALRGAISWALDPANAERVSAIASAGQRHAQKMTFAHYCADLETLLRAI